MAAASLGAAAMSSSDAAAGGTSSAAGNASPAGAGGGLAERGLGAEVRGSNGVSGALNRAELRCGVAVRAEPSSSATARGSG